MKIIVCIKQVPSTNQVKFDPETKTIIRDGRQSVINPFDTYAIEEAVRLIEQAEVLIVGGTSLAVYPAAGLIDYYKGDRLVLINRDATPYDRKANL